MVARARVQSKQKTSSVTPPAREAVNLDKLIHERMRLGIVSALASEQALSFTELKALLDTSDGNLSVHARKLEEAGYIRCEKSFQDRKPLTKYSLTARGKKALDKYLKHLEAIIQAAGIKS